MSTALRSIVKRAVGWETEKPRGVRGWLRRFFLRDVDVALRYGPVLPRLTGAGRVLDVGSGPVGPAAFAKRHIVGVDRDFGGPRHSLLSPVAASLGRLPFADGTFDLVLCFDVFEHLDRSIRNEVFAELCRVCSGTLFLAFPFGEEAAHLDRLLADAFERKEGKPHRWLSEHLRFGLPKEEDLAEFERLAATSAIALDYAPVALIRLFRREELGFRPLLNILRRFLLPLFATRLWRIPARHPYRRLLAFHFGGEG